VTKVFQELSPTRLPANQPRSARLHDKRRAARRRIPSDPFRHLSGRARYDSHWRADSETILGRACYPLLRGTVLRLTRRNKRTPNAAWKSPKRSIRKAWGQVEYQGSPICRFAVVLFADESATAIPPQCFQRSFPEWLQRVCFGFKALTDRHLTCPLWANFRRHHSIKARRRLGVML
jgi:hypothetical protein